VKIFFTKITFKSQKAIGSSEVLTFSLVCSFSVHLIKKTTKMVEAV